MSTPTQFSTSPALPPPGDASVSAGARGGSTAAGPIPPALRTSAATALRWSGAVLSALLLLWVGWQVADQLAQRSTQTEHSYPATDTLVLVADGEVTVTTGGTMVEVVAHAVRGFASTSYTADESGGRLELSHECRGIVADRCTASLDVRVPEGAHVTISTSSGAISAVGVVGDVQMSTGNGSVTVDGVTGRVLAVSGSGDVEVSRVRGSVDASTNNGEVLVHEAGGAVVARSSNGDIDVRDAAGSVEASTNVGAVAVRDVQGDALVDSGSGPLDVRAVVGNVQAITGVGSVVVREAGGDAVVDAGSGRLEVAGVLGDVRATTSNGQVVVRSTGEPVELDIATANGRSTIDAPTDPDATRSVYIRSGSGDVFYVGTDAMD